MCQAKKPHDHSRRSFVAQALGTFYLGCGVLEQAFFRAGEARAQANVAPQPSLFNIQKISDRAYAAVAKPQTLINCNAVIFENANDLLIVDAHSKPSAVAALVQQIRREVTQKPIRYIVNTHFHWDHTQGDGAYRKVAPDAKIVTSSMTRNLLSKFGTIRAQQSSEQAQASLDGYHHRLEAAANPQEKAQMQRAIAEVNSYVTEMRNYQPELPDITFDSSLVIHDKAHELHLAFRGRGHTAGDVVVFCPESKVLATGDLLHGWFPFIADGYPREWPKTLQTLKELPFEMVMGGHGQVQHGDKRLGQVSSYLSELSEKVAAGKKQGRSAQELQASITPDKMHSLDEDYRSFLVAQSSEKALAPAQIVAAGLKGNVADVFSRVDQ